MATTTPIEIPLNREEDKKTIDRQNKVFKRLRYVIIGFCVCIFIAFLINRPYFLWSLPVDESLLGSYGDFVGGFIGTLVTLYSVYLLVETLNNQIIVNSNIVETNNNIVQTNKATLEATERQIIQSNQNLFDSKFNVYLRAYQESVNSYKEETLIGKAYLDVMVERFRTSGFKNNLTYSKRADAAIKQFQGFYAKNRTLLSVHMRTLYLLMQLIAEKGEIEEPDRVAYAKCIRGQLTESEMFLIRYNSYTEYGYNMQKYVNRFNLMKNLPTMSLLEFLKWRNILWDKPDYINAIDIFFLTLRSEIVELLLNDDISGGDSTEKRKPISLSKRYSLSLMFTKDKKRYEFTVKRAKARNRTGYSGRPIIENALDCFTVGNLRQFMFDFHYEFFHANNFNKFNGDNNMQRSKAKLSTPKPIVDDDVEEVSCVVTSDYPIILKYSQLDHP